MKARVLQATVVKAFAFALVLRRVETDVSIVW